MSEWEHHYPGWEWAGQLFDETGEKGLLLASDRTEWRTVLAHSDMLVVAPRVLRTAEDFVVMRKAAFRTLAAGEPVAIMRSLYESEDPEVRQLVTPLVSRLGTHLPGRRPEYLLFPREHDGAEAR